MFFYPTPSPNLIWSTTYNVSVGIFSTKMLWYRGCCTVIVLSSSNVREQTADGLEQDVFWRSERPVGYHSRGYCLSCWWDYLWIMPIRSPPTAMCFRLGAALYG